MKDINHRYRLVIPILMLLSITSCGKDRSPEETVTHEVGLDGVVEVVSYAPEPLPAPWRFEQDLVLGVEYGEEEYMLRNPSSFAILEDGTHIILDSSPSQIRIYDADGRFQEEFGQPGDGPSDLPRSVYWCYVAPAGKDRFYFWNRYGMVRVQHWETSGALISVTSLNQRHPLARPSIVDGWDGSHLIGRKMRERAPDSYNPMDLIRTSLDGTTADSLFFLDNGQIPIACGMIEAELGLKIMSDPLVTSDGRVCIGPAYEDWIRVIDPNTASETLRFRWNHKADVIPDTLITHYRGQIASGQDMEAGARWLNEHLSIVQIAEGVHGEIWVQRRPRPEGDDTWMVDVFNRDGEYRGRMYVPCPPSRMKPFGDYMYGIGTNGEAPALIRYKLIHTDQ